MNIVINMIEDDIFSDVEYSIRNIINIDNNVFDYPPETSLQDLEEEVKKFYELNKLKYIKPNIEITRLSEIISKGGIYTFQVEGYKLYKYLFSTLSLYDTLGYQYKGAFIDGKEFNKSYVGEGDSKYFNEALSSYLWSKELKIIDGVIIYKDMSTFSITFKCVKLLINSIIEIVVKYSKIPDETLIEKLEEDEVVKIGIGYYSRGCDWDLRWLD